MRDGALVYTDAQGAFDVGQRRPLTLDTIFNIGSISKQFTAFAVLLLAQEGKLSLDDSVRRYIPQLGSYADVVTLRHLLHHVGGLRDYVGLLRLDGHSYSETTTRDDALRVLSRQTAANAPPGIEYDYSNTGYFLLSVIVERVSGLSFAQFSKERIFDALGMRNTRIIDHYPSGLTQLARGYLRKGTDYLEDGTLWEQVGDGQVHTTVADLARWADNLLNGRVGGRALITRMREPYHLAAGQVVQYGTGLGLGTYRGVQTLRHGGDWAGFHSYLLVFPEQRFAVSTLCNWLESNPSRYSLEIADLYLEGALRRPDTPAEIVALRNVTRRDDVTQMPAGLYRNAARASYVRLVSPTGAAAVEIGVASHALRSIEPRLYEIGESGDDRYAVFLPPAGTRRASIVIQESPEPIRYKLVDSGTAQVQAAGTFASDESDAKFVLTQHSGRLVLSWRSQSFALEPMSAGEFIGHGIPEEEQEFTLQVDPQGNELRFFTDGLRAVRFTRDRSPANTSSNRF